MQKLSCDTFLSIELLRNHLAGDDFVDDAIFFGLFRSHDIVAVVVFLNRIYEGEESETPSAPPAPPPVADTAGSAKPSNNAEETSSI